MKQHGENAPIEAAMRSDALFTGDLGGYAAWKRILRAEQELHGVEPVPSAAAH